MNKEVFNRLRLGVFVITGIVFLIVGLYFIGSNKNMFGKTFRLYATFYNVNGLQTGNNVRFSGIDVGTVQKIIILNDTSVRVEMNVDVNLKNFIRKNSVASIGTDGLMGNKLIAIEPGAPGSSLVSEGDEISTIKNIDTEQMLRTLEFTNQNVAVISSDLKEITGNINKSKGTLYTVLMDTTLAGGLRRTLNHIESFSNDLRNITSDVSSMVNGVKKGEGVIGSLLNDTSQTARDFRNTLSNLEATSRQFSTMSTDLQSFVNKLNSGQGAIATAMNDTLVSTHLKRSIANIDSSAYNFNENMKALQENFLFRKYFRRIQKNK